MNGEYPVRFAVDYPTASSTGSTAFRIFTVIPIAIVLGASAAAAAVGRPDAATTDVAVGGRACCSSPPLLMILFRAEVPALVVRLEPRTAAVRETASASTSR